MTTKKFYRPPGWIFNSFQSDSGYRLRYGVVQPAGKSRGTVVFTGGYGRHIEYYYEAINNWRDRGYTVYAMDWAGMGGSDREESQHPRRPPGMDFAQHARMFHEFTQRIVKPAPDKPAFLASHSQGGNIMLRYMHMYEKRADYPYQGAILGAPLIDINTAFVPRMVFNRLVRAANRMGMEELPLPSLTKLCADFLEAAAGDPHEDPSRAAAHEQHKRETETMELGYPTAGWFKAAIKSCDIVRKPEFLEAIRTPVLILTPDKDSLVSVKAQEMAALYLPHAALVTLRGAQHGLWYDNDRVQKPLWGGIDMFVDGLSARFKPRAARHEVPLYEDEDRDEPWMIPPPRRGQANKDAPRPFRP